MNGVNYYPVSIQNFERIKSVGNYVVTYALLDDRIHMEITIENAVFASQKFYPSIETPDNYNNDPIALFIRQFFTNQTSYQYFPTKDEIVELKKIKLYSKLIVRKYKVDTELNSRNDKIVESDDQVRLMNDEKVVMVAEKIIWLLNQD